MLDNFSHIMSTNLLNLLGRHPAIHREALEALQTPHKLLLVPYRSVNMVKSKLDLNCVKFSGTCPHQNQYIPAISTTSRLCPLIIQTKSLHDFYSKEFYL